MLIDGILLAVASPSLSKRWAGLNSHCASLRPSRPRRGSGLDDGPSTVEYTYRSFSRRISLSISRAVCMCMNATSYLFDASNSLSQYYLQCCDKKFAMCSPSCCSNGSPLHATSPKARAMSLKRWSCALGSCATAHVLSVCKNAQRPCRFPSDRCDAITLSMYACPPVCVPS